MATAVALVSCGSPKEFVYLQDMNENEKYAITEMPPAVIHINDRVSIVVNCKSPALAVPFNSQFGPIRITEDGNVSGEASSQSGAKGGYVVDSFGNIKFPILGELHIEGLTLNQVSELIRERIIKGSYINDPQVTVEFMNFKYTVLGAAGVGVYSSSEDRVTILDALAKSGDIAVNGRVDNVMVLREQNGYRQIYRMDLRKKDIFENPGFYLQQNDVVYVEPKYRGQEQFQKGVSYFSTAISLVSTFSTFILLMISLKIIPV